VAYLGTGITDFVKRLLWLHAVVGINGHAVNNDYSATSSKLVIIVIPCRSRG